jgi:hypothetical protein
MNGNYRQELLLKNGLHLLAEASTGKWELSVGTVAEKVVYIY